MEHALTFDLENRTATKYNEETGEVLERFRMVSEEDDKNAQKQREGYMRKQANDISLEYGRLNRHVGCFQKRIADIVPTLSLIQCGFLITLLAKLKLGGDGFLINNNERMGVKEIAEYVGLTRQQTTQHLKTFTELGVLEKIKHGRKKCYRVNPQYHIMGEHNANTNGAWFIRLYKTKLYEMVSTLYLNELGFIYKALPICHFRMFYLVHNPNETYRTRDEQDNEVYCNNKLEFYNRAELSEYMNEHRDNITEVVNSLRKKGLIMTSHSSRVVSYRLHPHIVYPKGTLVEPRIQAICDEFELHKHEAIRRAEKENS